MKYRDPYRHYRRQARRGWRGRRDGYPIMFIGTGEPLSLIAAAALGRLLYRHRSAFAPFAITSAAFIAAEMIHRHHPRYWLAVAGVTAAVTILAGIPHRLLVGQPSRPVHRHRANPRVRSLRCDTEAPRFEWTHRLEVRR